MVFVLVVQKQSYIRNVLVLEPCRGADSVVTNHGQLSPNPWPPALASTSVSRYARVPHTTSYRAPKCAATHRVGASLDHGCQDEFLMMTRQLCAEAQIVAGTINWTCRRWPLHLSQKQLHLIKIASIQANPTTLCLTRSHTKASTFTFTRPSIKTLVSHHGSRNARSVRGTWSFDRRPRACH